MDICARDNVNKSAQTAALLFSEYICLAIMSFPWSYSILGLVPGLILTVVVAALVLYTSLIVWYVEPYREACPRICNADTRLGNSAYAIQKFVMFVILASICSGTPGSHGG